MKMNKKKLAVVSLVLCIAAIISMGSLAWFQSTDTVDNTLNFVKDFEMDLYETDEEGEIIVDPDDDSKTIGQTYENIRPGDKLHKDPTVINKTTDESMWVRMTVTVTGTDVWTADNLGITDLTSIFEVADDFDDTWKRYDAPDTSVDGQISYTFYLKEPLAGGETATLFTAVNIPEDLTIAQAKELESCKITVTADAIQAEGDGLESITDPYDAFGNWTEDE